MEGDASDTFQRVLVVRNTNLLSFAPKVLNDGDTTFVQNIGSIVITRKQRSRFLCS